MESQYFEKPYDSLQFSDFSVNSEQFVAITKSTIVIRNIQSKQINSKNSEQSRTLTAIASHPKENGGFALAFTINSQQQPVHQVVLIDDINSSEETLVFEGQESKGEGKINVIQFSPSGKYLLILNQQPTFMLYHLAKRQFARSRPPHFGKVLSAFWNPNQEYLCSIGYDGKLKIYEISQDKMDIALLSNQSIAQEITSQQNILIGSFNPKGTMIAAPGKSNLREISISETNSIKSAFNPNISHKSEIYACLWNSDETLVTYGGDNQIKVWNHRKNFLIRKMQSPKLLKLEVIDTKLLGLDQINCKIFEFQLFDKKKDGGLDLKLKDKTKTEKSESAYFLQIKKFSKLKNNRRYLLYNSIGYITERIDVPDKYIELEYHDPRISNKKTLLFKNKQITYMDLQKQKVAFATKDNFGFKTNEYMWEYPLKDIQQICLGTEWLAVANDQEIKIFDHGGNQLQSISFDRPIVAMAGYENLLAIIYHDRLPKDSFLFLRLRLFKINEPRVGARSLITESGVPTTPKSTLKAFGFSNEGMIYIQDNLGRIRLYNLENSTWLLAFDPQSAEKQAYYQLVGISNYQILAIKDSQESRVVLRNIKFDLSFLYKEQNFRDLDKKLGQLALKNVIIHHEKIRSYLWYYLKYSRTEQSSYYQLSTSVLSQQQIREIQASFEEEILGLVEVLIEENKQKLAYEIAYMFLDSRELSAKIIDAFIRRNFIDYSEKLKAYYIDQTKSNKIIFAKGLKVPLERFNFGRGSATVEKYNQNAEKDTKVQKNKNAITDKISQIFSKVNTPQSKVLNVTTPSSVAVVHQSITIPGERRNQDVFYNPFGGKMTSSNIIESQKGMNLLKRKIEQKKR